MKTQQLEIALASSGRRSGLRILRRPSRVRWWFAQMRRAADEAMEDKSGPDPERPTHVSLFLELGR